MAVIVGYLASEMFLKPKEERASIQDLLKGAALAGGVKWGSEFVAQTAFDVFWKKGGMLEGLEGLSGL